MNIIETHDLTRRFGRTEAVHALNFAVPEGSICALLGPNGAGKSTALKLLLNLVRPTAGRSSVLGVDSRRLGTSDFARIGYVSEGQQLPLWMTVREFLDFCRPLYPAWDPQLEARLLRQFELPPDRRLEVLSRGMRMKAALLSSLAYRPRLLVLDEPFSGLDPLVRDELIAGLLEVVDAGDGSVLVATHDIAEVERLADRVVMLADGTARIDESVESLQARYRRVTVDGNAPLNPPGGDLLEWEQSGALTRFVISDHGGAASAEAWRERFPEARLALAAMSLREIFVTLARAGKKGGNS